MVQVVPRPPKKWQPTLLYIQDFRKKKLIARQVLELEGNRSVTHAGGLRSHLVFRHRLFFANRSHKANAAAHDPRRGEEEARSPTCSLRERDTDGRSTDGRWLWRGDALTSALSPWLHKSKTSVDRRPCLPPATCHSVTLHPLQCHCTGLHGPPLRCMTADGASAARHDLPTSSLQLTVGDQWLSARPVHGSCPFQRPSTERP